jgi:hypothetical protein
MILALMHWLILALALLIHLGFSTSLPIVALSMRELLNFSRLKIGTGDQMAETGNCH